MTPNLDIGFDADHFMALPLVKRIEACTVLAKRAQALAAAADGQYQSYYLDIAKGWLDLALKMREALDEEQASPKEED